MQTFYLVCFLFQHFNIPTIQFQHFNFSISLSRFNFNIPTIQFQLLKHVSQQEATRTESNVSITTETAEKVEADVTDSSTAATTTKSLTSTTLEATTTADADDQTEGSSSIVDCIFKIFLPPPKSPLAVSLSSQESNHLVTT